MKQTIQYTIRDIPPLIDRQLRAQAQKQGISLNKLVLKKLGAGNTTRKTQSKRHRDLNWMVGCLPLEETRLIDAAIKDARDIDRRRAYTRYQAEQNE